MKRMIACFGLVLVVIVIGMATSDYAGSGPGRVCYVCGDADGNGVVNDTDIVYIMNYVFSGGPAPYPIEAGDANRDGRVNTGDALYLANYLYKGGPEPACAKMDPSDTAIVNW